MTVPAAATLQAVNTELGRGATTAFYMDSDIYSRYLAKVSQTPGSAYSMSSFSGAQASVNNFTVTGPLGGGATPNYGFDGSHGSVSPTSFFGLTLTGVWGSSIGDLYINSSGSPAQNLWSVAYLTTSLSAAPFTTVLSSNVSLFGGGQWAYWTAQSGLNIPARNGSNITVVSIK